jgi:tetratricopeptide (TPR) repeat protein
VALSLTTLANIYREMGDAELGAPLLRRAVAIGEEKWGPLHPDVRWMHRSLARNQAALGRYEEAESGLRQLLERIEAAGEETALPSTLYALSSLLAGIGRFEQAEQLCLRAIEIDERNSGKSHPYVAEGLRELAKLYQLQERTAEATAAYGRALQIHRNELPPEDSSRRELIEEYTNFLEKTGQQEAAELLAEKESGT